MSQTNPARCPWAGFFVAGRAQLQWRVMVFRTARRMRAVQKIMSGPEARGPLSATEK